MSYPPQPRPRPNWFTRLSPLARVGVISGAVVTLCCGGALGLALVVPGGDDDPLGDRPAAVAGALPADATGAPGVAATAQASPTPEASATPEAGTSPEPGVDVTASPTPRSAPTTAAPKAVYYANCAAVRNAGKAPLREGRPGYRAALDADGDGVACESATRANGGDAPNPPKPRTTTSKPKPEPEPKTDPRFDTCKEAKAHGYGPYRSGETEYGWYRDADGDGIVCE